MDFVSEFGIPGLILLKVANEKNKIATLSRCDTQCFLLLILIKEERVGNGENFFGEKEVFSIFCN